MQLGREIAGLGVEHPVDDRVHILVRCDGRRAVCEPPADRLQPCVEPRVLVRCQDPRVTECRAPRARQLHIEGPQAEVNTDRSIDRLERGGAAGGKSATPEPVAGLPPRHATVSGDFPARRAGALAWSPLLLTLAVPEAEAEAARSSALSAWTRCGRAKSRMKPAASAWW